MFEYELIERFAVEKAALQNKLAEIGDVPGSAEIESQIISLEIRVRARIRSDMSQGADELLALRHILMAMERDYKTGGRQNERT